MSTKTIYKCDRCKAEQETQEQFWHLTVQVHGFYTMPSGHASADRTIDVCRRCCEDLHMLPARRDRKDDPPPEKKPTIEESIREIVRVEGQIV